VSPSTTFKTSAVVATGSACAIGGALTRHAVDAAATLKTTNAGSTFAWAQACALGPTSGGTTPRRESAATTACIVELDRPATQEGCRDRDGYSRNQMRCLRLSFKFDTVSRHLWASDAMNCRGSTGGGVADTGP
jgi:hypothetical protein